MTGMISRSHLRTVWAGQPGTSLGMQKLVVPDGDYKAALGRGGTLTQLLSGGYSKSVRPRTRRAPYTFSWSDRTRDELDPIRSFYTGAFGPGPFCLIDPLERNLLSPSQSTCGRQLQTSSGAGWTTNTRGANLSYVDNSAGPGGARCGVFSWQPTTGDVLFAGATVAFVGPNYTLFPDVDTASAIGTAIPYIADVPSILSCYARLVTGAATVRMNSYGLLTAGTLNPPSVGGDFVDLTADWVRLSTWQDTYPVGWSYAATPWIAPGLLCYSASDDAEVEVTCPQVQVGSYPVPGPDPVPVEYTHEPWLTGLGVPRVITDITTEIDGTVWDRQSLQLLFYEV